MSNLSIERYGTWVEGTPSYAFCCKIAAIFINLGFMLVTIIDIFKRLTGEVYFLQSESENTIDAIINVFLIICLILDFLSLTTTTPVFPGIKWRPGWAQLLGIINVFTSQLVESLSNSEKNVTSCIYRLTKSMDMNVIMKELCQSSDMIQYLGIVVSGLRDCFLCVLYITVSYFHQKTIYQSNPRPQQSIIFGRTRFVNT
ncbi:unnamed protein product [Rhizopus stolonifer]